MAAVHWVVRAGLAAWLLRVVWNLVKAMLEELE
jgi:hypothetical protein